jgi:hypothetical protein
MPVVRPISDLQTSLKKIDEYEAAQKAKTVKLQKI